MIPGDGPDVALVRIIRRLRLPYSQNYVARAVAGHPRPSSLLALVEVAAGMGLRVRPYQADVDALGELSPPLIVHFGDGFGVVERVSDDGYSVWDSANGARVLDRDTFLAHWSGVVAVVEHDPGSGVGPVRYMRHRVADVLWGSLVPPSMTAGRAAPYLRAVLGVLVVALLVPAVLDRPRGTPLVTLAALGLAATAVMAASGHASSRLCRRGGLVDCESVLTSRYARIAGIPLSDVGVAFYAAMLGIVATSRPGAWHVVALAYVASLPASALLVAAQVSLRRLCVLCCVVHAVNVAGVGAAWSVLGLRWPGRADFGALLLFALFFVLMLFAVVPSFRSAATLSRLSGRQNRMSVSPFLGLADVLTEMPTRVRGPECGIELGGSGAAHELVVFVHPSCKGCGPVLREAEAIVRTGSVRVFVAVAPRDDDARDRQVCEAIVASGIALGPEAMLRGYDVAKAELERGTPQDAVSLIAADPAVGPNLDAARQLVARAEAFATEYVEGTPAVFFDARPYDGWLSHLVFLLEHHPDLLEPIRIAAQDGTAPS